MAPDEAVRRWSAAIREIEVVEPWLTESHWDENYWDDVATSVVRDLGNSHSADDARAALEKALRDAFPGLDLRSDNGLYRDRVDERLSVIVELAMADPTS